MNSDSLVGDRPEAFLAMLESGMTMTDIGALVGLSRERVRQLIRRTGSRNRGRWSPNGFSITLLMRAVRDSRHTTLHAIARSAGLSEGALQQHLRTLELHEAVLRLVRLRRFTRGLYGSKQRHGQVSRYRRGCRCDACTAANSRYMAQWKAVRNG